MGTSLKKGSAFVCSNNINLSRKTPLDLDEKRHGQYLSVIRNHRNQGISV